MVSSSPAHSSAVTSSLTLTPDQDDLVTHLDGVVAAVDHQLVHGDHTQDRSADTADEHATTRPGRGGEARRRRSRSARWRPWSRDRCGAAARRRCPRPSATRFTIDTSARRRHRRAQAELGRQTRGRRDAVDGDPGADEVVAATRDARWPSPSWRHGAGRARCRRRPARRATASNRSSCTSVNGLSGSSATAQCVNTPSRSSSGRPLDLPGHLQGVGRSHADAVHPGVDLEVDPDDLALLARRRGQQLGGGDRVHADAEVVADHGTQIGRSGLGEQEDRRVDAGLAQHRAFLDQRHPEPVGPGGDGRLAHRDGAVAVTVGLHHGAEQRRRRPRPGAQRRCGRPRRGRRPPGRPSQVRPARRPRRARPRPASRGRARWPGRCRPGRRCR